MFDKIRSMQDYWVKQRKNKALFPDLLWSRPENKRTAGKLLIIGGSTHSFSAPAEAYTEAIKAGVGHVKVMMPDATKKVVGNILENVEFSPSNNSGSFSQTALSEFLDLASWADGVLIAGDLGRNSETAILIEKFLDKYTGQVTLVKDAVDYIYPGIKQVLERENTLLLTTIAQLQKIFIESKQTKAITYNMDLINLVDALHEFTSKIKSIIITKHLEQIITASKGLVSTTHSDNELEDFWRIKTAAHASVWWLQNPSKQFEAITSSIANL